MADAARRAVRQRRDEEAVSLISETFSHEPANTIEEAYGDPEALRYAIASLPVGQKQAVELLKLRELSLREASAASGTSVAALKVAAHRGIRALRMRLTREV
jgi:RNA polymerase sigma-70 factor (ECF subfamily)